MELKKMAAPIFISLAVIAYYLLVIYIVFALPLPAWLRTVILIGALLLIFVMVKVLRERIQEIKDGEEDDLSQY